MGNVYYHVQVVKRENCGYKTYTTQVEASYDFEEKDLKKAKNLWKKRVHNDIIRHDVTYLDKMPFYKDNCIWGTKEFNDKKCCHELVFRDPNTKKIVEKIEI